jgi:hypothetical protein
LEVGRQEGVGRAACTAAVDKTSFFWILRIWKKLQDSVHKKKLLQMKEAKVM